MKSLSIVLSVLLKITRLLWLLPVLIFFVGCGVAKIPHVIVPDYGKHPAKLIAVMPVKHNGSADPGAAEMLRTKLVEELYFKGYPRIPVKVMDDRLAQLSAGGESLSPQRIGEDLRVDGILYATLQESRPGRGILFGSTAVEAEFELRSAKTGESLWRARHRIVYRSYGFTSRWVELKSVQVYETAIQEVLNKVLETLPDAVGS